MAQSPLYLFGIDQISRSNKPFDLSDSHIRLGHEWRCYIEAHPSPTSIDMQLAMLHMAQAMKQATVNHLRYTAGLKAGEHLHLPEATAAEVAYETEKFHDSLPNPRAIPRVKTDPLAILHARKQEVGAEIAEHIEQNISEMKSAFTDAFMAAEAGNLVLAEEAVKSTVTLAARTYAMYVRQGVKGHDARKLMSDIMDELFVTVWHHEQPGISSRMGCEVIHPLAHQLYDEKFEQARKSKGGHSR